MATEKHSLHSKYPSSTGWVSFLFLIGNAALQIYSHVGLSAVIKLALPNNGDVSFSADVCTGEANYTVFLEYMNSSGLENHAYIMGGDQANGFSGCGLEYGLFGFDKLETCLKTDRSNSNGTFIPGFKGPDGCLFCYQLNAECGKLCAFGTADCATDNTQTSCLDCIDEKGCNEIFNACGNVTLPPRVEERRLLNSYNDIPQGIYHDDKGTTSKMARNRELQSTTIPDDIELFVVYEISFISALKDAYNGGAYGIFLVIFLFSGVWPYGKNCVMFVSWFVPMTWETRSLILKNLTRLAKWSLVDVFAIVIIIAGLRINKPISSDPDGGPLVIIAESRIAIYTFCVAAIWDLVQGEWMRHMHLRAYEKEIYSQRENKDSVTALLNDGSTLINEMRFAENPKRSCTVPGSVFTLAFMCIQIAFVISSVFLIVISFNLYGEIFADDDTSKYTAATIASTILDEKALQFNDSVPGTVFLVVMYLLLSIAIPIFQFGSIIFLTFVGWDKVCCNKSRFKTFFEAVDIIGGFSCQDVFVLSFVVVIAEWDKLVNSAAGNVAGDLPCTGPCLGMTAEVGVGIYVMSVAFLLGWICEMWITNAYSQLIHPVEKVWLNNFVFNVVSSFGCTRTIEVSDHTHKVI